MVLRRVSLLSQLESDTSLSNPRHVSVTVPLKQAHIEVPAVMALQFNLIGVVGGFLGRACTLQLIHFVPDRNSDSS